MNFADRLIAAIREKNSVVCVGLDPRLNQIPSCVLKPAMAEHGPTPAAAAAAFVEFNKGIIDAVKDVAVMVKPQIAFYEQYGWQGVRAFEETCAYAREQGLLVLVDAKRNDIGSTAEAYARAFLGEVELFGNVAPALDADALTVNGYLGVDGILPFARVCQERGKGIFVLVKTSNPSSGDLQDRRLADESMTISELMAHFVESWGQDTLGEQGYHSVGAVVGATYPKEAAHLRALMPGALFLVPGYGAQGGGAEDVKPCFDEQGLGAIVNSSRGIIFAYEKEGKAEDGSDYADCARAAAERMREDLNRVR